MQDREALQQGVVEFIGTFALIFLGAGAIIMTGGENLVAIAFAHGLAIAVMIAATGHISGGLFNPALTVGFAITGRLTPDRTAVYLVSQFLGSVAGALALIAIFSSSDVDAVELGTPALGNIEVMAAVLAEVILTFFLMYVVFGAAVDQRGFKEVAPFAIGLTITADIFALGAMTGAAMNPARWFGPALVQGFWADGWVWLVGPIVGAAVAALLYQHLLMDDPLPEAAPAAPDQARDDSAQQPERKRSSSRRRRRR